MAFSEISRSPFEAISLIFGLLAFISGLLYFLQKYSIISLHYEFSTDILLLFFPGMTIIAGLILILSTVGMFGAR